MKEKFRKFKRWYLRQYEYNKVLFLLIHFFILVVIIAEILRRLIISLLVNLIVLHILTAVGTWILNF